MFEGVQDQFHQFLAANSTPQPQISSSSSLPPPPPLSFSLLHGCASSPSAFHDPYINPQQSDHHLHQQILQHQQQLLQWAAHTNKQDLRRVIKQEPANTAHGHGGGSLSTSLALERARSMAVPAESTDSASWSHDEILALLRIRSALENWFPEFTWEHVSRKLSELGFKRSPQKCKERFEEEEVSRSFFHTTKNNGVEGDVSFPAKNYRLFNELEELCHHNHHHHQQPGANLISPVNEDGNETNQGDAILDKQNDQGQLEDGDDDEEQDERLIQEKMGQYLERPIEENDGSELGNDKMDQEVEGSEERVAETLERKKTGRGQMMTDSKRKFEMFKSFCEEIVSRMMSQQEELHNKILQDMIRRDEEKTAREEAWRRREMERVNKEMEARARDLAMVSERQAKIIEFLRKFASSDSHKNDGNINELLAPKSAHQNPSSSATHSSPNHLPTSSNEGSISQTSNPNPNTNKNRQPVFRKPRPDKRPRSDIDGNDDIGKRWPREEVLALINIRCNIVDISNKTGPDDSGQNQSNSSSNSKNPPLWERISQKMLEMGYKRSAKRCKEKWENINKYFRKTKDMNKNRSVDSRTCPYFHQLSHLYNHGRVNGGVPHGGGGGGGPMDVSDQGEDIISGVQVTMSAA